MRETLQECYLQNAIEKTRQEIFLSCPEGPKRLHEINETSLGLGKIYRLSSDSLQEKKYFRQREDSKSGHRCKGPEVVFRKPWAESVVPRRLDASLRQKISPEGSGYAEF